MTKVKFDELERHIGAVKEKAAAKTDIAQRVEERLKKILGAETLVAIEVDLNDDDFEAVAKNRDAIQQNLAGLVQGLDQITMAFGDDFKSMAGSTWQESMMGFFSKNKAEQMRSERVKQSSIQSNLNELIRKSDVISEILREQLAVITEELATHVSGQAKVHEMGITVAKEIEDIKAEVDAINPKIDLVESKLSELSGAALKEAQNQRDLLLASLNDAQTRLQSKVASQQSLERYAKFYATAIESLTKQKAAQVTMIEKLGIDTEQRTILYDGVSQSLRTSEQQNVAHRIDDIGKETDAQAEEMMLQIGASAENRIASMMEAHQFYMQRSAEIEGKRREANATFGRRFGAIIDKVETGKYVEAEN